MPYSASSRWRFASCIVAAGEVLDGLKRALNRGALKASAGFACSMENLGRRFQTPKALVGRRRAACSMGILEWDGSVKGAGLVVSGLCSRGALDKNSAEVQSIGTYLTLPRRVYRGLECCGSDAAC